MISPASVSNMIDLAEAATAPPESATQAPADKAFDAVLALENLAATCKTLDPLGAEAALNEALAEGGLDEDQDGDDEDLFEEQLNFLTGWLQAAAPAKPPAPAGTNGEAAGAAGGALGRTAGLDLSVSALNVDAANDVSPEKLLAIAGQEATAVDGQTTARDGTVDPAAHLARATELFTAARPGASERAAIPTHVRDPRWADDLGARMVMMARGGESQASLQLSPVELGPLDVSVTVRDSQASIHFGAANAETRALIEASIPRLREMLAAQGFDLTDASVSQGFSRQAQANTPGGGTHGATDGDTEAVVTRVTPAGLLDLYA